MRPMLLLVHLVVWGQESDLGDDADEKKCEESDKECRAAHSAYCETEMRWSSQELTRVQINTDLD